MGSARGLPVGGTEGTAMKLTHKPRVWQSRFTLAWCWVCPCWRAAGGYGSQALALRALYGFTYGSHMP